MDETLTVSIEADTSRFETALENLEKQAQGFGDTLASSLQSAVVSGKSLDDILRKIALNMVSSAFSSGIAPLQSMMNNLGSQVFSSIGSIMPFANGGIVGAGGVINAPSYFPMSGRTGLMGEAGPEAIVPLTRGSDGRLGVASAGGQASQSVNVTIQASDINSFRKSEAQISGAIARAVARGSRSN